MGMFVRLLVGTGLLFISFLSAKTSSASDSAVSKTLQCTVTSSWAPFNTRVDGRLSGIGLDYWHLIVERLGLQSECTEARSWGEVLEAIRTQKKDLTVATEATKERESYAVFSHPYSTYPYVVVTRKDVGFIYDIRMLRDKKILVGRGYSVASTLREHYPKLPFEETDTIDQALDRVVSGDAYAVVDVLPVLAYKLNHERYDSLKISGMLPEVFEARIMLRRDYAPLLPSINRVIDTITDAERRTINQKWIRIQTPDMLPRKYFYFLILAIWLVVLFYYAHTHRLKQEIKRKTDSMEYLEKVSRVDSLTKICNRHTIDKLLLREIAVVERYRKLLSVIFFDVDSFKKINDTYGHAAGDNVLIELTELVSASIRESDIFGRWGGDEFLIILPESSQKQAKCLADTLEAKIAKHTFERVGRVSCSFGVAAYQYGDTMETLIERADTKLYESKKYRRTTA